MGFSPWDCEEVDMTEVIEPEHVKIVHHKS